MFRAIVVPLDGSPLAERALPIAARLARATGSALHLAHVHTPSADPILIEGLPVIDDELRSLAADHERVYLERHAAALSSGDFAPVPIRLAGHVVQTLTSYARDLGAGLIVMTTHGRSGFAHFWLGSVAEAAVRVAVTPTLLLRPAEDGSLPQGAFRRVLVPLDGSALAEEILPAAAAIARAEGGELALLRLTDPRAADEQAEAEGYLEQVAGRGHGVPVRYKAAPAASPAQAIIEAAASEADLVAITTRGRGAVRGGMSSVADKVLRGTTCPLLILRPEGGGAD